MRAPLAEEPGALFARLRGGAAAAPRRLPGPRPLRDRLGLAGAVLPARRGGVAARAADEGHGAARPTADQDEAAAAALRGSEKERAENLMIVDMLRNDLGRVAELGSVEVASLFDVERYPTLLQMTLERARRAASAPLSALFAALFPCASVTGAPKKRTMEIVAATEVAPRGVYTGAIGWAGPDGARGVERRDPHGRGRPRPRRSRASGPAAASWPTRAPRASTRSACSRPASWRRRRSRSSRRFALLPGEGFRRLDGHLARLAGSARHFGFPLDMRRVEEALRETAAARSCGTARVRLLLPRRRPRRGARPMALPPPPHADAAGGPRGAAGRPGSVWLYHKTTRREIYDEAAASRPDCDDVLLWNDRGELTESTIANVVVEIGGPAAHAAGRVRPAARRRAGARARRGPRARGRRADHRAAARPAPVAAVLAARLARGAPRRLTPCRGCGGRHRSPRRRRCTVPSLCARASDARPAASPWRWCRCSSSPRRHARAGDPSALFGGRLRLGGEVSGTIAPEDHGFFNYNDYETNTLRLFRIDLMAEARLLPLALAALRRPHGQPGRAARLRALPAPATVAGPRVRPAGRHRPAGLRLVRRGGATRSTTRCPACRSRTST